MRLVVISHTPHYRTASGGVVGWGPTVRELDQLATRFSTVTHIAHLHDGPVPESFLPYANPTIELVPLPPSGGDDLRGKWSALAAVPAYARTVWPALRAADVVHVRAPANVALVASLLLLLVRRDQRRWIKYAGNWGASQQTALSYRLQRWYLRRPWHRGIVTVNGTWPDDPPHVRAFYNPSLTDDELASAAAASAGKVLDRPVRLLFVGRMDANKGAIDAVRTLALVRDAGCDAVLDLIGDGPERARAEAEAARLGVAGAVRSQGWLPRTALGEHYAAAHMILAPSRTEGWPKVLAEAMAARVVPIAAAVGAIPEYLRDLQVGTALADASPDQLAAAVLAYVNDADRWNREAERACKAAHRFTYSAYLRAVDELLREGPREG
jgi:glycosyltransferase involved in cell wall biosynthesis